MRTAGGAADDGVAADGTQVPPDEAEDAIRPALRRAQLSESNRRALQDLQRNTLDTIPVCIASRVATAWAESIEGCLAGNEEWSMLSRFRSRLLLAASPHDVDRNTELKARLTLWERGHFDDLVLRVCGQQAETNRRQDRHMDGPHGASEEAKGKRANRLTAANAVSKAVKGLVGGVATGSTEEREEWTIDLIPRSTVPNGPCASASELDASRACSWGSGDVRQARQEMRRAGKRSYGPPKMPWVRLVLKAAPGPSGDRQEHLDAVMESAGASQKRSRTCTG